MDHGRTDRQQPRSALAAIPGFVHAQIAEVRQEAPTGNGVPVLGGKEDLALPHLPAGRSALLGLGNAAPLEAGVDRPGCGAVHPRAVSKRIGKLARVLIVLSGGQGELSGVISTTSGVVTNHQPGSGIAGLFDSLPGRPGFGLKRLVLDQMGYRAVFCVVKPVILQLAGGGGLTADIRHERDLGVRQPFPRVLCPALQGDPRVGMALDTTGLEGLGHLLGGAGIALFENKAIGLDFFGSQPVEIAQIFDQNAGISVLQFDPVRSDHTAERHAPAFG